MNESAELTEDQLIEQNKQLLMKKLMKSKKKPAAKERYVSTISNERKSVKFPQWENIYVCPLHLPYLLFHCYKRNFSDSVKVPLILIEF